MTTEELIKESNQVVEKHPCPDGMELKTYREGIYMALIWRDKLASDGDLANVSHCTCEEPKRVPGSTGCWKCQMVLKEYL